jgi:cardiolipin synthase
VTRRDIPNLISVFRLLLVPLLVLLLLLDRHVAALLVFFIAGLSDAADGFLARHFGWSSELGAILDPLADKLLMISVTLTLAMQGLVPLWLAVVVVVRDAVIVGGAVCYRLIVGRFRATPSLVSKFNTGLLILLVLATIAVHGFAWSIDLAPLFLLVGLTTVVSGADYVYRWARRARSELGRD